MPTHPSPRLRERFALLTLVAAALSSRCVTPPTSVLVVVDTDVRDRVLSMRAIASAGSIGSGDASVFDWARTGSPGDFQFPASFGMVPGGTPIDGTVALIVELVLAPATPSAPITTVQRRAHFRFVPHVPSVLPIFIPVSCAAEIVPPRHCVDTSALCTVSRFCSEMSPAQTCGDNGTCVSVDVSLTPIAADASIAVFDVSHDITRDTGIVATMDAAIDTSADTASEAGLDVPADVAPDLVSETCAPSCGARVCGSDGCTGTCGTCATGQMCNGSGQCVCAPSCAGRACGSDGCGGSCGTCSGALVCNGGGQCVASCTPSCAGRSCGSDGCTGSCGSCGASQTCDAAGHCVCAPSCAGRACGSDGCGGSCGSCGASQACDAAGHCVCAPNCAGRACGSDGCGGSCGSCGASQACDGAGHCVCAPNCAGRACGADSCGGSCGSCGTGSVCNGSGQCVACAQGASCTPSNDCVASATIDCASGAPVCTPTAYVASGTTCFSSFDGAVCDGSGRCHCLPPRSGQCFRCGLCSYSCTLACP